MRHSLSIVIPVYNERGSIAETVRAACEALKEEPKFDAEIVVVDDGSTDGTADALEGFDGQVPVRVLRQDNAGRFAARARGLAEARGDYVLFLDARVRILPGAFEFLAERVGNGDGNVWNAHCVIEQEGNPYGVFWNVLTEIAFSSYFDEPRTTSFDAESFERFPKGTTCFFAPRADLADAFGGFSTRYAEQRFANDDTPIIRALASRGAIGISPGFACSYRPRDSAVPFLRHAVHRGIVFLDGHGRRESGFFPLVVGFYPLSALAAALVVRKPLALPALFAATSLAAAAIAAAKKRTPRETAIFAALAPVYAAAHGAGMWRGAALLAAARARRNPLK